MRQFFSVGVVVVVLFLTGCANGPSSELKQGWELMVAEDYAAAREHYENLLKEHPDNPYALLNLGVAYQRLGDFDNARPNYEAAIEHGSNAQVTRVAETDGVQPRSTTIADLARQNLETLSN